MTRLRLALALATLTSLQAGPARAQQENPASYCKAHPGDLKCKAYLGANSAAHSDFGNSVGRQQFVLPQQTQSMQRQAPVPPAPGVR